MEIGDYVRTNMGFIKHIEDENDLKLMKFLNGSSIGEITTITKDKWDLIEYGDLVKFNSTITVLDNRENREKEIRFLDAKYCDGWTEIENDKEYMVYDMDYLISKDQFDNVDWILTHEQIKADIFKF